MVTKTRVETRVETKVEPPETRVERFSTLVWSFKTRVETRVETFETRVEASGNQGLAARVGYLVQLDLTRDLECEAAAHYARLARQLHRVPQDHWAAH